MQAARRLHRWNLAPQALAAVGLVVRREIVKLASTWTGLRGLVKRRESEAVDLEFKRDPYAHPGKSEEAKKKDRRELPRDVTSMANAGGGVLIVGIEDR